MVIGRDSGHRKLILFDWDKTLSSGESLDRVGDFLDVRKEIEEITEMGMEGKIGFKQSLEKRIELINSRLTRGAKMDDIVKVVDRIPLDKNAGNAVKSLRESGFAIGIVSGGLDIFMGSSVAKLKPDFLFASRTKIDRNGIRVNPLVDKGSVVSFLRRNYGFDRIYAVGDGGNDIKMLGESDVGIGYKPKNILVPYCRYIIDDLMQLIRIIKEEENA